MNDIKKPTLHEVKLSKEIVKRWYLVSRHRNKTSAMVETKKIYEMLDYLENHCGLDYFY